MSDAQYEVTPIGTVRSPLTNRASAPKQGYEGSPDAWLEFVPGVLEALQDVRPGDQVIVLTWLDRARRDDLASPEVGVFSTRSPDRPNPIGLHVVEVLSRDQGRLQVRNLEALDGTPVIDLKPVLPGVPDA
jgi:tRNA-Thr(GGU) m(6)t(6)A37 methyltransferase TsaA